MINLNTNSVLQTFTQHNSPQKTELSDKPLSLNTGLSSQQALHLSQKIANLEPAQLFNAGANKVTGYAEALSLID